MGVGEWIAASMLILSLSGVSLQLGRYRGRFESLEDSINDLKTNDLARIDQKIGRLFGRFDDVRALCAERGEKIARLDQQVANGERRLGRLETKEPS